MLRVSIDEREDPDDEQEIVFDGIPIVASNEVIDGYGEEFEFYIDDNNMPSVRSASGKENGDNGQGSACQSS